MTPWNQRLYATDIHQIIKLRREGYPVKDLAKKFGVHPNTITKRLMGKIPQKRTTPEVKEKIIQAIESGYTKPEAAILYDKNIGTVLNMTRGIPNVSKNKRWIIRQAGIDLLNRLLTDGCLVADFKYDTIRRPKRKMPAIQAAHYRGKTFYYLKGREEKTIEEFFKQRDDHVIDSFALKEISFLLGVKISKENQEKLIKKYKEKHRQFIISKRLQQFCLEDFLPDDEYPFIWLEPKCWRYPKQSELQRKC